MRLAVFSLVVLFAFTGCSQPAKSDIERLREKAAQGDADAQYNLGVAYANGEGVPEDDAEAVKWYRDAAEQGHAEGRVGCANMGFPFSVD